MHSVAQILLSEKLIIFLQIIKFMTMTGFQQQTLIEVVLYVLNKTKGVDFYHLFKILYFANKAFLAKWGIRIIADDFCALDYGPVPTNLYNAVKNDRNSACAGLIPIYNKAVEKAGEDAPNVLIAKRPENMDYISQSVKEELDKSIYENLNLSFSQLKDKSHDSAWAKAYNGNGRRVMDDYSIALAAGADERTLRYILEQEELCKALA